MSRSTTISSPSIRMNGSSRASWTSQSSGGRSTRRNACALSTVIEVDRTRLHGYAGYPRSSRIVRASRIAVAPSWSLLKYTNASLASAAAIRDAHRRSVSSVARPAGRALVEPHRRATRAERGRRPGARSMRPDEGGAMPVELVEHVGGVPRGISELERRAHRAGGWRADDAIGPRRPGTEGSRNSTGPEPVPEPFRPFPEALGRLLRIVQPLEVGDEPARPSR